MTWSWPDVWKSCCLVKCVCIRSVIINQLIIASWVGGRRRWFLPRTWKETEQDEDGGKRIYMFCYLLLNGPLTESLGENWINSRCIEATSRRRCIHTGRTSSQCVTINSSDSLARRPKGAHKGLVRFSWRRKKFVNDIIIMCFLTCLTASPCEWVWGKDEWRNDNKTRLGLAVK